MGGETLEYLESLFDAGDFEELENNGECLSDWIVVDTKIGDKMNITSERIIKIEIEERKARELCAWIRQARKELTSEDKCKDSVFEFFDKLNYEVNEKEFPRLNRSSF